MKFNRAKQCLPNILTFGNLFTGFLAITLLFQGKTEASAWLLLLCLVFDSLDGNIAKLFNHITPLGRELDSLSDLISFVSLPSLHLYVWFSKNSSPHVWLLFFFYLGAGTFRLARFNLLPPIRSFFRGLPTPAAASLILTTLHTLDHNSNLKTFEETLLLSLLVLILSVLMISSINYPKLSAIDPKHRIFFMFTAFILFCALWNRFSVETALLSLALLYVFSTPFYPLIFKIRTAES